MMRALRKAASRERANICPIPGVHAAAETALIDALDRRGFIVWDNGVARGATEHGPHMSVPRISESGRAALVSSQVSP